ncbi:MAG TPA: hypothetical protein VFR96_19320 [Povalibacter sp.]|jgi:hypothetical protein|nr:hypothetical protein [Povalibacter sp.]
MLEGMDGMELLLAPPRDGIEGIDEGIDGIDGIDAPPDPPPEGLEAPRELLWLPPPLLPLGMLELELPPLEPDEPLEPLEPEEPPLLGVLGMLLGEGMLVDIC